MVVKSLFTVSVNARQITSKSVPEAYIPPWLLVRSLSPPARKLPPSQGVSQRNPHATTHNLLPIVSAGTTPLSLRFLTAGLPQHETFRLSTTGDNIRKRNWTNFRSRASGMKPWAQALIAPGSHIYNRPGTSMDLKPDCMYSDTARICFRHNTVSWLISKILCLFFWGWIFTE